MFQQHTLSENWAICLEGGKKLSYAGKLNSNLRRLAALNSEFLGCDPIQEFE